MLLTELIMSSFSPEIMRIFENLFSRNILAIHDRDLLDSIDLPVLVKFDDSFDIDMLSFRLIGGVVRIQIAAEFFDTFLDIKRRIIWDRRQPFNVIDIYCGILLIISDLLR